MYCVCMYDREAGIFLTNCNPEHLSRERDTQRDEMLRSVSEEAGRQGNEDVRT